METINDSKKNVERNYVVQDHHLIKSTRVIVLDKLTATEIYSILSSGNTPNPQKCYENFDWKKVYILPRVVTINSFQRNFHYKILQSILYLNKMLFIFGKA